VKKTKTGFSTDTGVLEILSLQHPLPKKILEYRTLTKLKNTYIDVLPTLINPHTGRIHTTLNQMVVSTGRLSSSDPNLQNIPIRGEDGVKIREPLCPKMAASLSLPIIPRSSFVSLHISQRTRSSSRHFCGMKTFIPLWHKIFLE
jgi:DNA polymerase I-like protein with 3'-5' exonuclease and polymerase domains